MILPRAALLFLNSSSLVALYPPFPDSVQSPSPTSLISNCLNLPFGTQRLPRWCNGEESACQSGRHKRHRFDPLVGKSPWRRAWQPTP